MTTQTDPTPAEQAQVEAKLRGWTHKTMGDVELRSGYMPEITILYDLEGKAHSPLNINTAPGQIAAMELMNIGIVPVHSAAGLAGPIKLQQWWRATSNEQWFASPAEAIKAAWFQFVREHRDGHG